MQDLVVQAQHGDREAFAALVAMTSDRMYALAARILRDNFLAEDALQGAPSKPTASVPPAPTLIDGAARSVGLVAPSSCSTRRPGSHLVAPGTIRPTATPYHLWWAGQPHRT